MTTHAIYNWETRADYIQACKVSWPGGPTEYNPPRAVGEWEDDVTSFKAGQAYWSEENLPDILYMIKPEPEIDWRFFRQRRIHNMRDEYGREIPEKWPRPGKPVRLLRDFPILQGLDVIGSLEHPLFLIALRRLDPAIEWQDIEMRMDPSWRPSNMQQRVRDHWMRPFMLLNWHFMQTAAMNELFSRLSPQAIAANSTRGYIPGLMNPAMGEAGGRIHYWASCKGGYGRGRMWDCRVGGSKRDQYVYDHPHLQLLTPHIERDRRRLGLSGPYYDDPNSKTWAEWERENGIESPEVGDDVQEEIEQYFPALG